MTNHSCAMGLIGACGCLLAAALPSQAICRSELALARFSGDQRPELILAQRTINREWGLSEDSVYVEAEIPGWRSEGIAMGLSAAVPGLGQAYAGEPNRGLWFALAEVVGWTTHLVFNHRGSDLRNDAQHYAGAPTDSASTWSFQRWAQATQGDAGTLEALYAGDPETFYDAIGKDSRLLAGWAGGNPAETRATFADLRAASDERLRNAHYADVILMVNHVVAAVDAVRLARLHNVSLQHNLDLKLKTGWRGGGPALTAILEARF